LNENEEDKAEAAENDLEAIKETVFDYVKEKDIKNLKTLLHRLDGVEALFIMNSLSRKEKALVFRLLDKECALYVFEQLETALQKELLESFTDEYAREIIEELDPDDRAGLLDEMPAGVAKRLLSMLSSEERKITNRLMGYKPQTAGRIMTPEFISLREEMTAEEALNKVRKQAEDKETIYTLYVTDISKRLFGVLSLKHLLIADAKAIIKDIMTDSIIKVDTDTDQEKAVQLVKEHDLLAIPVVDKEDRIVGIITHDDAMDILEHEATEDIYNQAGLANIKNKEKSRSEVLVRGSLWAVWKIRLPFLAIAIAGGILAALLIDGFEDRLSQVFIVAFFIPLIMDLGGSVGTQSTTVFARGLALGHIDTKKFGKHLLREVGIGLSIGIVVGIITGIIAGLWGHIGNDGMWQLGFAVGIALMATVTVASFIGFLVPFVLVKMKLDQVAGAAPIITTIKDVTGLLVYFALVLWLLSAFIDVDYCQTCYICYYCR